LRRRNINKFNIYAIKNLPTKYKNKLLIMTKYEDIYFKTEKTKEIEEKILNLQKEGKYLEAIMWLATIFEAEATILISLNEEMNSTFLKKFGLNVKSRTADDIRKENKTLGALKKELEKYYYAESFIKDFDKFIYFRNFLMHKIFETKISINYINEKIASGVLDDFWNLRINFNEKLKEVLRKYVSFLEKENKSKF
jgi:hypothetical protein